LRGVASCSEYPTVDFRARTLASPPGPAFDALKSLVGLRAAAAKKRYILKTASPVIEDTHSHFIHCIHPNNLASALSTAHAQLKTVPEKLPFTSAQQW
jgi:hypothetical protein